MPPATRTGIFLTLGNTFSIKAMVVCLPIWPPASMPSTTMASAPAASIRLASFTLGTTGITLMPAAWNFSIWGTGLPAPKVTKATFSSQSISIISAILGAISITFTPKGLSVSFFALRTSSRVHSTVRPPLPIMPAAPALETAAAKTASLVQAIPP